MYSLIFRYANLIGYDRDKQRPRGVSHVRYPEHFMASITISMDTVSSLYGKTVPRMSLTFLPSHTDPLLNSEDLTATLCCTCFISWCQQPYQ